MDPVPFAFQPAVILFCICHGYFWIPAVCQALRPGVCVLGPALRSTPSCVADRCPDDVCEAWEVLRLVEGVSPEDRAFRGL